MLRAGRFQCSLRFTALSFFVILMLSWRLVLCLGGTDQPDDVTVKVGKTVEITASYKYLWYPTVHRFSTGEMLATMRMSPDETSPEGEFSAYCLSRDGGETWSRRYPMGAGANIDAAYTQVPRDDGAIWGLAAGYGSLEAYPPGAKTDFHVTLTKYSRGGMEIQQIRDAKVHLAEPVESIPVELFGTKQKDASPLRKVPSAQPFGAIIDGPGGEWLNTLYYTAEGHAHQHRLALIRSVDQGQTWEEVGLVGAAPPQDKLAPWMGSDGPGEAGLVRLSDTRLFCIFRSGGDNLGEVWSSDDGKTWSPPVSLGFKGVAPHLRLLSNGLLAFTTGRPGPVTLMFSSDEGKTWVGATTIFSGRSTRYSDLIELEPGKLFVIYDSVPYWWGPIPPTDKFSKNAICGTFVEVRRR